MAGRVEQNLVHAIDSPNGGASNGTNQTNHETHEAFAQEGDLMFDFLWPEFFEPYLNIHPQHPQQLPKVFSDVFCHTLLTYTKQHEIDIQCTGSVARGVAAGEMPPGHWELAADVQQNVLPQAQVNSPEYNFLTYFSPDAAADMDTMMVTRIPNALRNFFNNFDDLISPIAYKTKKAKNTESKKYFTYRNNENYIVEAEFGIVPTVDVETIKISFFVLDADYKPITDVELPPDRIQVNGQYYQRIMRIDSYVNKGTVSGLTKDNRVGETTRLQDIIRLNLSLGGEEGSYYIQYQLPEDAYNAISEHDAIHLLGKDPSRALEIFLRSVGHQNPRRIVRVNDFGPAEIPSWLTQDSFFGEVRRRFQEFVFWGYKGNQITVKRAAAELALHELYLGHQFSLAMLQTLYECGFFDVYYPELPRSREIWEQIIWSKHFLNPVGGRIPDAGDDPNVLYRNIRNWYMTQTEFSGLERSMHALRDAGFIFTEQPISGFLQAFGHLPIETVAQDPHDETDIQRNEHFKHVLKDKIKEGHTIIESLITSSDSSAIDNKRILRYLIGHDNQQAVASLYALLSLFVSGMTAQELKSWYLAAPVKYESQRPDFDRTLTVLKLLGVLQLTNRSSIDKHGNTIDRTFYSLRANTLNMDFALTDIMSLQDDFAFVRNWTTAYEAATKNTESIKNHSKVILESSLNNLKSSGIGSVEALRAILIDRKKSAPEDQYRDYFEIAKMIQLDKPELANLISDAEIIRTAILNTGL